MNNSTKVPDSSIKGVGAIWVRVSSDKQDVNSQLTALEEELKERGLEPGPVYKVPGKSAFKGEHEPDLLKAIADAGAGRYTHLFFVSLDRLDRRGSEFSLRNIRLLREAGATVVSLRETYLEDDSGNQDVRVANDGDAARSYAASISYHVSRALKELGRDHKITGSMPWVYRWDIENPEPDGPKEQHRFLGDGTVQANPERTKVAKLIFDLYVTHGLGVDRIVDTLSKRLILAPKGGRYWFPQTVQTLLGERSYATGLYGKHEVRVEQIIDLATFDRADKLRVTNNRFKPSTLGRELPLRGAICIACNSPFGVDSAPGRATFYFCRGRYKSSPHFKRTDQPCNATRRLRADVVEPLVLREILDLFRYPANALEAINAQIDYLRAHATELEREIGPIHAQLAEIKKRRGRNSRLYYDGQITDENYERNLAELDDEKSRSEKLLETLGPDQLAALEETREALLGAEQLREIAEVRAERGWLMDEFNFAVEVAETDAVEKLRDNNTLQLKMPPPEKVSDTLAMWLRALHAEVFVSPDDYIDIRCKVPAKVLIGDDATRQTTQTGRGLGWGRARSPYVAR